MQSSFKFVTNYTVPTLGQALVGQYKLFPDDMGNSFVIAPNKGAPVVNTWQSVIIDSRNMSVACIVAIGKNQDFPITILPGIYKSYQIPAYLDPAFWFLPYDGAPMGTNDILGLIFQNFPCVPQEYELNPIVSLANSYIFGPGGSEWTFGIPGPYRFVDLSVANISSSLQEIAIGFKLRAGGQLTYYFALNPGVTQIYSVWKNNNAAIDLTAAQLNAPLPNGMNLSVSIGV